jgi:integrase/recombinase XerD
MSVKPIGPLRARVIEHMTVRNFVPDTQREYIRAAKKSAAFLKCSADTATAEELRFFFKVTVGKPEGTRHLAFVYEPRKLRRVLPPDDVNRFDK